MSNSETDVTLKPIQVPSETVSINLPTDVVQALTKVAEAKDMSLQALLRQYISQSLRDDLAFQFSYKALERLESVLNRHLPSDQSVDAVLSDIRNDPSVQAFAPNWHRQRRKNANLPTIEE
ncbi:MAG: hypothetical protein AAFU71_06200 [Cyanobacteria bacterium J06632_22]